MPNLLLADLNYLSHRAFYTTGSLSYEGQGTGVAFGVLRTLEDVADLFGIDITVIACDSRTSLRKDILPSYKSSRWENMTEEDKEKRKDFEKQIRRLKTEILPLAGYRNIFEVDGYEADDIIAKVAEDVESPSTALILSADQDLWQCLRQGVDAYNPTSKKLMTASSFKDEWKLDPLQWRMVKCLAGCKTDDIPNIPGIGEKSAAAYLTGALKSGVKYEKITANLQLVKQNMPLVKLPYPGLSLPAVVADEVTLQSKRDAQELIGVRSARTSERQRDAVRKKEIEGFDW